MAPQRDDRSVSCVACPVVKLHTICKVIAATTMRRAVVLITVLAAAFSFSSQQDATDYTVCYVKPENSNRTCPFPLCYTLQQYAEQQQSVKDQCRIGRSNTVYRFLDGGKHKLFGNIALNFSRLDSIFLLGDWSEGQHAVSHAEIECKGSGGFLFQYASNVVVSHLTFTECGHWFNADLKVTLGFHNIQNATLSNTIVERGTGYGLYALCAMGLVEVEYSEFSSNMGKAEIEGGNAGFLYENCTDTPSMLSIEDSQFLNGSSQSKNSLATGLFLFIWTSGVNVEIDNITAIGNSGGENSVGGNMLLILRNRTGIRSNWIVVKNSYIAEGKAYVGGGLDISILVTPQYDSRPRTSNFRAANWTQGEVLTPVVVTIINTQFVGNIAGHQGGGLYLITHEDPGVFFPIARVTIQDCLFTRNSLKSDSGGGVALHLNNHPVLAYLNHSNPQFYTSVVNCTIEDNFLDSETDIEDVVFTASSAVFVVLKPSAVVIEDSRIINNTCTGVTAVKSAVIFAGEVTVAGNYAINGGGIILCDGGLLLFRAFTTLFIQENTAKHAGGGIYAEDSCLQSEPTCFFQLDIAIYRDPSLNETIHVEMINNTAEYAGSAIFGGSVVYCLLLPQLEPDLNITGGQMFKQLFKIVHPPQDLSPVSSNPFRVCFCNQIQTQPDCNNRSIGKEVYAGRKLRVHVYTVGQANGVASHTVAAFLMHEHSKLDPTEKLQNTKSNCSELRYTVFSQQPSEVISLQVYQQSGISSEASRKGIAKVNIILKPCPIGFSVPKEQPYKCNCVSTLQGYGYTCDIEKLVIHRVKLTWIGCFSLSQNPSFHSTNDTIGNSSSDYGISYQPHCPYDFCRENSLHIKTGDKLSDFQSSAQCAYHRTGVLCGACESGYSLILGNSECRKCTSKNLSLLIVFAIAGLLLVIVIIVTDLSVSSGSLNGLIFYANLVQVNSSDFFGRYISDRRVYLCHIFISWLNLDFGIKTCFFNGMDAYAKTWLQFAFPLYVWGIAALIILLSRRFPSKYIAGRNPVKLLAALFLVSYAKLLRTIIRALSYITLFQFTTDNHELKSKLLWREDGNINYLQGKHIPLFVAAVGFGLVTLPYALVLCSLQWLQKTSHLRICSWVVRLKPLFDVYTAPYKPHCRFWVGWLLLLRVVVFLTFASPHTHPTLRLSLILTTCVVVQMTAWSFHGVFRSKYTDAINSLFFLNLGLFAAASCYTYTDNGKHQFSAIMISVGVSFVLFVFVLLYHTLSQTRGTRAWKIVESWIREKREVWYPSAGGERRRDQRESCTDTSYMKQNVTKTVVDLFDVQYREPLINSLTTSYGTSSD